MSINFDPTDNVNSLFLNVQGYKEEIFIRMEFVLTLILMML